jgi:hypothetical protein
VRRIRVASLLAPSYRDELERIVFFNPEQGKVERPVVTLVHRYGVPEITEEAGTLRFHLRGFPEIQSLFALDETDAPAALAGVVMFVRESEDTLLLLHLAVHEQYTARGKHAKAWVALRLVGAVRGVCARTKGVRRLRILYHG